MSRVPGLLLVLAGAAGCVYYNGMWSAEQLAKEARRADQRGSTFDARSYWARAAVKAESVVVQHPRSRWAGPALVLQGEGLARSGACDRAAAPLGQALQLARDEPLRERAALVLAECALDANDPGEANRQLASVTQSSDAARPPRGRRPLCADRGPRPRLAGSAAGPGARAPGACGAGGQYGGPRRRARPARRHRPGPGGR